MIKTIHPVSHLKDSQNNEVDYEPKCSCCPMGRSGHRIIVANDNLYSLGGFNPAFALDETRGHPLFRELWKFNLSTKRWQLVDDYYNVPPTIASHTIANVGRWLFLFGGTSIPFGETPSRNLYRYDLSAPPWQNMNCDKNSREVATVHMKNRWHRVSVVGDIPEERYGHTMTMCFPDVYIVGGTSGHMYSSDVYHLDLRALVGKWTKLSSDGDHKQPVGRYRHETVFDGETLYIFGGGTDEHAFSLIHIHTFNIKCRQWGTLKSVPDPQHGHPTPRKCHSCTQYKKDVFMVGGVSGRTAEHSPTLFNEVWRFSLLDASWFKYSVSLSVPLFFHSADLCLNKGYIYIFGGVTAYRDEQIRTKRILSLRVAVADLLELAWEVVCDLIGDRWEEMDLNELGIPLVLQSRLT